MFKHGDKVRVKTGVTTESYESGDYGSPVYDPCAIIDMSGYTGIVNGDVADDDDTVWVDFDEDTLNKIPQDYKQACDAVDCAYNCCVFSIQEVELVQ